MKFRQNMIFSTRLIDLNKNLLSYAIFKVIMSKSIVLLSLRIVFIMSSFSSVMILSHSLPPDAGLNNMTVAKFLDMPDYASYFAWGNSCTTSLCFTSLHFTCTTSLLFIYWILWSAVCKKLWGQWRQSCMTCQVWYVACHILYIYAMFHIFMPCFIYLCHDLYFFVYMYAMFYIFIPCFIYSCHLYIFMPMHYIFISISIHVASLFIYAAPRFPFLLHWLLPFMLYQHNFMLHQTQQMYVAIKICQQFHFFHHPIQWEVMITCSSAWSYLPYRIWNNKA